jgi:hypothetical protein
MVFFGSLGNLVATISHTTSWGAPVVRYDLVILFLPFKLFGTILGIILNNLLPEIFLIGIMIIIFFFGLIRSAKMFKKYS